MIERLLEEALDFRDASKIGGQRDTAAPELLDFGSGFASLNLRRMVVDYHVGTFSCEAQSNGAAQALRRASDQSNAIQERCVHRPANGSTEFAKCLGHARVERVVPCTTHR
jgi:hypothetical protein